MHFSLQILKKNNGQAIIESIAIIIIIILLITSLASLYLAANIKNKTMITARNKIICSKKYRKTIVRQKIKTLNAQELYEDPTSKNQELIISSYSGIF